MPKENIFFQRIFWHFFEVPKEILRAWKNFLLFNLNYFSIPLLLKTFFSPWRRYRESYGRVFDAGKYLETFLANIIYCTLGAMMRSFLIIIGLFSEIFIFFAGLIAFFGWIVLPVILIQGLAIGLSMIFK
ncbi:MAG: hypothetical protein NTZ84_03475 [Candidatus Nealsonbacteria bacterium]|nr:hypothetical protein [Candidatus Nealsonbacteria bacterium]